MRLLVCVTTIATLLLIATPALSACPQGHMGALPVIVDGVIEVRVYSSENISTTSPATQKSCVFLRNVGTTTIAASVDHEIREPGGSMAGPWELDDAKTTTIAAGGEAVTCTTTSGEVATTTATFGLDPGEVTNICCFTWEAGFPGSCSELPDVGDVVNHSVPSGAEVDMPIFSYIGGTTCGLLGIEWLLALALVRGVRRRRAGRPS